ncbi:hypothetical protein GCM10008983_14330 [Lentibacillus halophilus]|uniref:Uncharacterized protein n=1 Tax=Lentibacillus halophilus TaxID=295065 RepID=A0ABN0Z8B4_9BACI
MFKQSQRLEMYQNKLHKEKMNHVLQEKQTKSGQVQWECIADGTIDPSKLGEACFLRPNKLFENTPIPLSP